LLDSVSSASLSELPILAQFPNFLPQYVRQAANLLGFLMFGIGALYPLDWRMAIIVFVRCSDTFRIDSNVESTNMTKGRDSHHVVPNPDGGWDVRRGGSERSSGHFETKQVAVDRGREISRNQETEFVIHNRDGKIASSDSHGNDPFPPKG
jgi:Uncharacterized protein conserved in bacteria (DUF2188)